MLLLIYIILLLLWCLPRNNWMHEIGVFTTYLWVSMSSVVFNSNA